MAVLESGFAGFGRFVLMVLSVILVMLSIGMIVISALLVRAGEVANDNQVVAIFDHLIVSYEISLGSVMTNLSIGFLIVGLILLFLAFCGFFGALFKIAILLLVFGALTILVVGFEIFVLYVWFEMKDELTHSFRQKMESLLIPYEGNTGRTANSRAWNYLFLWFDCCGVNSGSVVTDFTRTQWNSSRGSDKIPGYCCRNAMVDTAVRFSGQTCTVSPTSLNSWVNQGCYAAVSDYMKKYVTGYLTLAFLIIFIGILAILFAFLLAFYVGRRRKMTSVRYQSEKVPLPVGPVVSVPQTCKCLPYYIPDISYKKPPYDPPNVYPQPVPCYGYHKPRPYPRMVPTFYYPPEYYKYDPRDYQVAYKPQCAPDLPTGRYLVYPAPRNTNPPRYYSYSYGTGRRSKKERRPEDETFSWYPSDDGRYYY